VHIPGSDVDVWALRTARERLLALGEAEDVSVPLMTVDWLLEKRGAA
jgi:hypothetical protein